MAQFGISFGTRPFKAGGPLTQGWFSIFCSRKGVLGLTWICLGLNPTLTLFRFSGVSALQGHTVSILLSLAQALGALEVCLCLPSGCSLPSLQFGIRYGLISFFLGSSQVLGSVGAEASCTFPAPSLPPGAYSDLAYHLLPSCHAMPHALTCVLSKVSPWPLS